MQPFDSFEASYRHVLACHTIKQSKIHTYRELELNGEKFSFMVDTGAGVTIISESTFNSVNFTNEIEPANVKLYGFCGQQIELIGMIVAKIATEFGTDATTVIYIAKGQTENLLDKDTAIKLKIIESNWCRENNKNL